MKLLTNEEIDREISVTNARTDWGEFFSQLIAQAKQANELAPQLAAEKEKSEQLAQRLADARDELVNERKECARHLGRVADDEDEITRLMTELATAQSGLENWRDKATELGEELTRVNGELAAARETIRRWERCHSFLTLSADIPWYIEEHYPDWGCMERLPNGNFKDRPERFPTPMDTYEQIEQWEAEQKKGGQ